MPDLLKILLITIVSLTLAQMMFTMGLKLNFTLLLTSVRNNRNLFVKGLLVNYLLIPALTLGLVILFHAPFPLAAGLIILGVSPAAPYGPPFTVIARGNLAMATALMIILAATSVFMAPLLLWISLPFIEPATMFLIDPAGLIRILFSIQLIPLFTGLAINQWRPELAGSFTGISQQIMKLMNALMVILFVILQIRVFRMITIAETFLMLILIISGLAAGWFTGVQDLSGRKAFSIITGMRNMSLSLGIATMAFPGSPVVTTVLIYTLIAGLLILGFAFVLRKR